MTQLIRAIVLSVGLAAVVVPAASAQGRYTMTRSGDVVELQDTQAKIKVSVLTDGIFSAYEMLVNGEHVFRRNFASADEVRKAPGLRGVPLLWPYANRLDEQAFYANGQKYTFDAGIGNTGRAGGIPIHGFVQNSREWVIVEARADATGAWVTARLDFYKNPRYMTQFPFANTLTLTFRVADGMLETRTRIDNLSNEAMPVAAGFHPYFQLTDSPPTEWSFSIGARTHWPLNEQTIPTGETQSITAKFSDPANVPVVGPRIDDIFSDLVRDAQGRSVTSLRGRKQRLDIVLGPNYKTVLVLSTAVGGGGGRGRGAGPAPAGPAGAPAAPAPAAPAVPEAPPGSSNTNWNVAIEPMAGISNSMNLAQKGLYKELQTIAPGGFWQESFWVRPSGF